MSTPSGLPLDGILVVACEQAVAAPLATRHLADLGARVIKIERPDGGDFARRYDETVRGMSSHFVWLNRGKESVALDLKQPRDLEVLRRLLERADVFVQNLAPGAAERLGLGADELTRRHPRLIVCSISGYGCSGPYRGAKAYDALVQAETGLMSITGTEDAPAKAGIAVADIGAGMYAFSSTLAALFERERSGRGTAIEVSLFDALIEWMGYPLYYAAYGGSAPERSGLSHAAIAPYGAYASADGTQVLISVQNEREWQAFCAHVLADAGLAEDPRFASVSLRVRHRDQLDERIDVLLAALPAEEIERRLDGAGIAHARLRDLAAVQEHPQLTARNRWTTISTPTGPVQAVLPPFSLAGHELRMGPVPALGEHTEKVLAELGRADERPAREQQ